MYLQGKRVFLAGGAGLAGAGAVRALLAAVPELRIRVPFRSRNGLFVPDPRVDYVQADLTDPAACAAVMAGCDTAVLSAAFTAGAQSALREPWRQVTENVILDVRLLEGCHAAGIRRLVYVSTATVYPPGDGYLREDALDWNRDPPPAYLGVGWAKRFAEKACRFWHEKTGMEVLIARPANIFGPGAKFDPQTSHFIAALIRRAADRQDPFEVWGSPDVVRDILYAEDFGAAVVAMLEATSIKFDVFNIGSGRKTTVGEVVTWALRHTGHQPSRIVYSDDRPATIGFRALDCDKADRLLGWRAAVGAEEGVRRTVAWWLENRTTWGR